MTPLRIIYLFWAAWVVSWLVASAWSAPTERRSSGRLAAIGYRLLTLIGAVLLFATFSPQRLPVYPLWRTGDVAGWLMAGLVLAGLLFAWWARVHLGRLWSSEVTRKVDHYVVDSGPYGLVRHPIYSGLLLSALATAIAKGTAAALIGVGALMLGLYFKAGIEERFLRIELGADAYDRYAQRVPMLVPFLK